MLDCCENGVLVTYSHESNIHPSVKLKNKVTHIIGIIDAGNVDKVFDKDHVAYLDALKNHKCKYNDMEKQHQNDIKKFFKY